jgi:hypothetical protein
LDFEPGTLNTVLIEPHYLPSLEYFCAVLPYDKIILEKHEHFIKQSFRNRCYIQTANGPVMLTVPLTEKKGKVPFHEVKIDYRQKWQNNHWRSIESAYNKAPFFEHYRDDLHRLIFTGAPYLADLDAALLSFCLRSMGLDKEQSETVSYEKGANDGTSDLRSQITPKKPFFERQFYRPAPYYQVFGSAFASNLSVIDLLFCEGPRALGLLRASGNLN